MRALQLIAAAVLAAGLALAALPARAEQVPHAAARYRSELIRNSRMVWGMDAPVAAEAAQVQQESGWNPAAHSSVASGLAEFTPATATWISGAYPRVGPAQPYNPSWALRALTTYDYDLWEQTQPPAARYLPATACDHMAFALSAYNGGIGWVYRDQALTAKFAADPGQPTRWWRGVA